MPKNAETEDKKKKTTKSEPKSEKKAKKPPVEIPAAESELAASDQSKPAKKDKKAAAPKKRNPMISGTYFAKTGEIKPQWRIIDATGQTLGRLSTQIATILMGKDKASFTRSTDTGDFVVVINAKDVVLTGKKWSDKVYQYHTNYPGGLRTQTASEVREKHPERLIELAVYRMLPKYKGHMVRHWFKKLKVYGGADHPHVAQQPQTVKLPQARKA
jgi:large subunit ribosomal protein L13